MTTTKVSFCRICSGGCGVVLTIGDDGRIASIRGDHDNALTKGYACYKGLQSGDSHHGPARLLKPLERQADGTRRELGLEDALDKVSEKLKSIIARHGPESVAVFCGNGSVLHPTAAFMQRSFLAAIGSSQYFTTLTIDQSAKVVSFGRLGAWIAGLPPLERMDCMLIFGANPLITHSSLGFITVDPVKRLKAAKARGMKLVTFDPRVTETAHFADLALQPLPGQDPAIAGGLIRLILEEGWEDKDFCARNVGAERMAALRQAVEPLTPDYVERRAGLPTGSLRKVAEIFARDSRTGCAHGATGPNMSPFSNLAQHLIDTLNVICGRFLRAGDAVHTVNVQDPPGPALAQVYPPGRLWESSGQSRVRGFNSLYGERLTGTFAEEVLTPGKGQIRAVIVDGGNPAVSLPDQAKALEALKSLELLVTIDPFLGPTSQLAHYVLPPLLQYERADVTANIPGYPMWPHAWGQYTAPVIDPPPGSDLADDWYMFWGIAKRLGLTITHAGKTSLPMDKAPTTDEVMAIQLDGAFASLDALKTAPHGRAFDLAGATVQPATDDDAPGQFDVMPGDVAGELRAFLSRVDAPGRFERDGQTYAFLLSVRRLRDFFNSNGIHNDAVRARNPYNPAFLNPEDMVALDVCDGDVIEIKSATGQVLAVAQTDTGLRRGVVSLTHNWGEGVDESEDPARYGACVNKLTDTVTHVETINAMPHMSAVPVNVRRFRSRLQAAE